MSSASGIGAAPELIDTFARAVDTDDVRVLKVSIVNETLTPTGSWPKSGSLIDDFAQLEGLVEDNQPAYLLVRSDATASEWLAISYVPDTAKVRDKMLYASTRSALIRALGDTRFKDSIFATSKADLTPDAYRAHLQHNAAPKPLSAREAEMEGVRAAERERSASGTSISRVDAAHKTAVGLKWTPEVENAIQSMSQLGENDSPSLIILSIDTSDESLVLKSTKDGVSPNQLSSHIPTSEPTYSFYFWPHQNNNELVASVIKHRMLYSSAVAVFVNDAKKKGLPVTKRTETSDPSELNEAFLMQELGHHATQSTPAGSSERVAFAKPRGPPRRR